MNIRSSESVRLDGAINGFQGLAQTIDQSVEWKLLQGRIFPICFVCASCPKLNNIASKLTRIAPHCFIAIEVTTQACFVAILVAIFYSYCHSVLSSSRRQNNILTLSSNNTLQYIVCRFVRKGYCCYHHSCYFLVF